MAYPRSRNQTPTEPRLRIDARTPDAKEMRLRNVQRDIGGQVIGGTNAEGGAQVDFPRPISALDSLRQKPASTAGMAGATAGGATLDTMRFPQPSAMKTGNSGVTFQSPEARQGAMVAATPRTFPQPPVSSGVTRIAQQDGTPGGFTADRGGGRKELTSVYGTGSSGPALPKPPGEFLTNAQALMPAVAVPDPRRIIEGGKDVTPDYAAGGKYSSVKAPPKPATALAAGTITPASESGAGRFPKAPPALAAAASPTMPAGDDTDRAKGLPRRKKTTAAL